MLIERLVNLPYRNHYISVVCLDKLQYPISSQTSGSFSQNINGDKYVDE